MARATCARSRSETPPIPPRRPTTRHSPPRRTTWTPRRASQPRSSKPSSGPRGAVDDCTEGENGTLWRRAPERQLEQDALPHRASIESAHLRGNTKRERRSPHRTGHDRRERRRPSQLGQRARCARARRDARCPTTSRPTPARARTQASAARTEATAAVAAARSPPRREPVPARRSRTQARRRRKERAASASCARSRRDQVPELLDPRRTDSRDRVEVVDRAKTSVLGPVVDDLLGRDGADARQRIELRRARPSSDWDGRPPAPAPASAPDVTRRGTSTCIPSASGAARLIAAVSADAVAPPAWATASATLLPSASR